VNRRLSWFLAAGLLVALLLAGVVSNLASTSPDGLDATARKGCTIAADGTITGGTCVAQHEQAHQLKDSPLAGYRIGGLGHGPVSAGLAGALGVLLTFGVAAGMFRLARRRAPGPREPAAGARSAAAASGEG
jgi:cobalt/nickel transport protein